MSTISQDARLLHDQPGRRFIANDDARWGEMILPAPNEGADRRPNGVRIMLFASMESGLRTLRRAVDYERRHPERIHIVGVITDDPANDDAEINLKKRGWHYLEEKERLQVEAVTIETALALGIPVYTGEIKIDWFHRQAAAWAPEAILVCGLGQVIDRTVIDMPRLGIYNFHGSDLAHAYGAGPAPSEDLHKRGATETCWTVHHLSDGIDKGAIVGQSPPVYVRDELGKIGSREKLVNRMLQPLDFMTDHLLDALVQHAFDKAAGPITTLDFAAAFPEDAKRDLMRPLPR